MNSYIRILLTIFIASAGLAPVSAEPVLEPASLPAPPAAFEQNLGQNDPSVRFVLRRATAAAALLDDHIVFGVRSGKGVTRAAMRWLGGNPNVRVEGLEQMVKTTSYFIGNDPSAWVTGVPSHNRVRYHQVYAGIDLDFFVVGRTLEYDFIVSPGADPAQIRLAFESETGVVLTQDGSLRFAGEGGEIAHRKPLLYQLIDGQRRLVEGRFVAAAANEFQFETGAYDPTYALVIDPIVTGRAFRGNGRDSLNAVAAIDADNLVAVGVTDSFDLVPGAMSNTGTNAVAFRIRGVSALIPSFEITSELLAGGQDDDSFTDVTVSSNGKLYMGGVTESPDFPFGSPLGGKDMFLGEWTPGGPYVIGVRFGGPDDDVFGGFARYTFKGFPQYGAFDANGDATNEFFTFGSVGVNTGDQFVQVRTWNADSFGAQGELHILSTSSGADPELNALLWNSSLGGLFGVGTSTGDLYPAEAHPGDPGTRKPFFFSAAASDLFAGSSPMPFPVGFFAPPASYEALDVHITGMVWSPSIENDPESFKAYVAGYELDGSSKVGSIYSFNLASSQLTAIERFSDLTPRDIFLNAGLNITVMSELRSLEAGQEGWNRGSALEFDRLSWDVTRSTFFGEFSPNNYIDGAAMSFTGSNLFIVGEGDQWPITSGPTEIQGPTDAWLGRYENMVLPPHGVVTAGSFQIQPLANNGIYTAFGDWNFGDAQVLGPINGSYPTNAGGLEVLIDGMPTGLTYKSSKQINFTSTGDVSALPTRTVQLRYRHPETSEISLSNQIVMQTAQGLFNTFQSQGTVAGTHNGGVWTESNPLQKDYIATIFGTGGGTYSDSSGLPHDLTPSDRALFLTPVTPIQALLDNIPYDLMVDYYGSSPGSIASLNQVNINHPADFWDALEDLCAALVTGQVIQYALLFPYLDPQVYLDPFGSESPNMLEVPVYAACPASQF